MLLKFFYLYSPTALRCFAVQFLIWKFHEISWKSIKEVSRNREKKKHFFLIGVPLRHGVLFRMKFCSIAESFTVAPLSFMSDEISHSSLVYSCKYIVSLGRRCFDTRWPCIKFLKLFILGLDIKQSAITNAILITIVQMVYFHLMIECGILLNFVCLCFYVQLENFLLIWRRHHYRWRASNFDIYSALVAIEQWGFFSLPHLLWH